jgi:predicted Zn-dependent protease with MMP-like domain
MEKSRSHGQAFPLEEEPAALRLRSATATLCGMKRKNAASLEEILDRLEQHYESGDEEKLAEELKRGRRLYPEDLALREWEAMLAAESGRPEEALSILDEVLAKEPGRRFAALERASALIELRRYDEALAGLDAMELALSAEDEEDTFLRAEICFERACCLDRSGRAEDADRQFAEAARLSPDELPAPPRLNQEDFEKVVEEALDSIPEKFDPYLRQVAVAVRDYPGPGDPDPNLLGLYVGIPRTERTHESSGHLDTIFLFKRNLEIEFVDEDDLREEIRKTVIHEIAHHFGLGEEEMGEYR